MEELKKKIFNILLNHSHASRTIATEELYELFVSKSKNSAVWVKASEFKTSEPVYRPYRRKRNNDNEEPYDYGEIYVTEDNGDIFFDVNNERSFEPQTDECWKDYEILDESGTPAAGRDETEGVKAVVDALTTIYGTMIDPVMARQRSADMLNMANQALCKYDKERKGPAAGREEAVFDSKWLIGRSEKRFKELAHKGWDWRSFYNGWIEGRSDAWCDFRGKESAVEFAEWAIREGWATSHDRKGWMKHSDETPYVLTTAELYELFKQQKENNG